MEPRIKELCDAVRECSFAIHNYLRQGHIERIYERALVHRLELRGICSAQQQSVAVHDEDHFLLGELILDLLVADCLIVEVKACKALADEHVAQLLGYMRATGLRHGILVNFGAPKLEIRKYIL